ncbi:MAG: tetratricopeptide repeat protein [Candidatus Omnitrophica bacterium]|nr:tetratricopeptide repeat protein [Candidatus Omnitrophota bacterium]MBU1997775.1 tetratricopeptide repeat protein [Candidatus Omnitrophota bacterium]MBU4333618.1 tetratricopeptide repeat protein [Candidatus Omnitrophota bacterium]
MKEGTEQLKQNNLREAIISFNKAVSQDSSNSDAHLMLGKLFLNMKEYPKAIEHFEASSNLQPDSGEIFLTLAQCYDLSGDRKTAISMIQRSIVIYKLQKNTEDYNAAVKLYQMLTRANNQAEEKPNSESNKEEK